MLQLIRTTLKSPYGAFCVRLRYTGLRKQGNDSWRQVIDDCNNLPISILPDVYSFFFQVGLDSRPVMREAYALFKDGGDPEKVLLADFPMCISICVPITCF